MVKEQITAETETGWSKEDPKVDGVYWWRADRTDLEPDIHSVVHGSFYEVGEQFSRLVENFGGEWLGPIEAFDTEQLVRLRQVIQSEIYRQCAHCKNGLAWTEDGRAHYGYEHQGTVGIVTCTASRELREALQVKD